MWKIQFVSPELPAWITDLWYVPLTWFKFNSIIMLIVSMDTTGPRQIRYGLCYVSVSASSNCRRRHGGFSDQQCWHGNSNVHTLIYGFDTYLKRYLTLIMGLRFDKRFLYVPQTRARYWSYYCLDGYHLVRLYLKSASSNWRHQHGGSEGQHRWCEKSNLYIIDRWIHF